MTTVPTPSGDDLVRTLATLANPHRMRVVAALARERHYVSGLARRLGISRALLQLHLKKLEACGLVTSKLELSEDGKAMKFYELAAFDIHLTPASVARAADDLTVDDAKGSQE
ncbi:helix-turn-helix domain-containing protein [Phytomonospora sp. NPDC050363]|uniref:ArsR/SmtB family transcription factor n=1 Tax=Phytomonospora sp. NPDC050363 TaxID=3155642 RepID=UPI0033D7A06C